MRGRQLVHVVDFAVGGHLAVEPRPVPRRDADLRIGEILARVIPDALNLIGSADLVTLVPVIGLVQVGAQSMADRYKYIPLIGIFIIVTW